MTITEMQAKAEKAGFYAVQLLALKELYGPNAKIGCLVDTPKRIGTFTELNTMGWCGPEANDIDNYRVPTIREQLETPDN